MKCVLKVLTPRFNQCGPWFGDVQIGANASLLQIFHVAETSMMVTLLLRVCVKKFIFLVGLSRAEKLFFLALVKVNCGLFPPGIAWFKVSSA